MTAMITQLVDILEQSQKVHERLLINMQREKEAALGSQVQHLTLVIAEKESLLAELSFLEKRRSELLGKIATQLRLGVDQLKLSVLVTYLDPPAAQRIERVRVSLQRSIQAVRKTNEENRYLIRHCLELVQGALSFMHHWLKPSSVYGASGHINDGSPNGHLISGTV